MTVPYRKKLIEVALPLKAINEASVRENFIYRGNPSAVHKWWAQRPLAACRAVLFASLVDDPDSDPTYRKADGTVDEDRAGLKRAQLFNLIEELVQWENSNASGSEWMRHADEPARWAAFRSLRFSPRWNARKRAGSHGPSDGARRIREQGFNRLGRSLCQPRTANESAKG